VPRREIDRLTEEVQELFEELWRIPRFAGARRGFRPAVDVFYTEDPRELTVVVDLAGVNQSCVKIAVTERQLVISGARERPRVEGQVFQQAEIEYGPFERQVALAEAIEPSGARATYRDGFLTIVLPIAKATSGPVKVPIQVRADE
jgi:HSP20 family protein